MRAKKCDRCGNFYLENKINYDEQKVNGISFTGYLNNPIYMHRYSGDKIDLCDSCLKEFINWLSNDKKAEEQQITIFERIKQANIDELVELIYNKFCVGVFIRCQFCPFENNTNKNCMCKEKIRKWLRSRVKKEFI